MAKKFKSITEAQLDFTLKFMRMQHNDDSSTVFSSVSIATAMAMMYLGAEGNTSKEISNALAEGFVESEIHDYFTSLLKRIKKEYSLKVPSTSDISYYGEDYNPFSSYSVLETVNQVYVNEELTLKQNFVEKFDELYHGGIEKVNFAEASKVAMKINHFITDITRNKINNMVTESDFDAKTSQIVLINAVYFKGRWQNEFSAYMTKDANFYLTPDKIKKAKMMKLGPKYCRYSETEEFQFLSLPYMNSDLSMKILLPKKKFQLADVIANLTAEKLMEHLMKQRGVEVIVKIPKFDIKTKFDATLPPQSMGIKDLFEKNSNLEGMTDIKPTWLSSVLHSAFICIDEEGTEAGAITAGDLRGCGLGDSPPPKPIKFKADHPFIYLITDEQNNIYFCGTITGAEFDDNGEIPPPIKEKLFKNPVTGFVKKLFEKKS